jgi:GT2 family glycosyltransferase
VTDQPRVRRNDWGTLRVPELGAWEPTLSVSVVIPAYDASRMLPIAMAGLAAQTYPSHLLEVVVVDDGPGLLQLPPVRPERSRIVRVGQGWGRANACHLGATVADGEVLHWLDVDMLVERHHVEAQLRWHHALDYAVVLGHKWFVDPAPVFAATGDELRRAVDEDRVEAYFEGRPRERHWVEDVYERTDDLRQAGPNALRTHVGATASLHRSLYLESGGMDTELRLGEDISLGHRLAEVGAVFVPERAARSWHLGRSQVMGRVDEVTAYNDPFLADRVPNLRGKRRPGRTYAVPYLEVILDVREQPHASVTAVVDALLNSALPDLVVTLLGDWDKLSDERLRPLDDPQLSTRIVRATYRSEPRVRMLHVLPPGQPEATFRLHLPTADWVPLRRTLADLVLHVEKTHEGLRRIRMPDGSTARLERTAAFARASRVAEPGEDLDDVVDEVYGASWTDADELGFAEAPEAKRPQVARTGGPPLDPDEAWAYVEKAHGERKHRRRRAQEAAPEPEADPAAGAAAVVASADPDPDPEPEPEPEPRRGLRSMLRRGSN